MKFVPILLALLAAAGSAHAAPTVSVSPAANSITIDQEFDVSILINVDVTDISCYSLTLDYDETLLELVSSTEGVLFSGSGHPTFFSQEDDGTGQEVWTNCLLGFGTSVAGPGELVKLRFKGILDGTSQLDLMNVVLRDVNRNVIVGVVEENGSANVSLTSTPPVSAGDLRLRAFPNPSGGAVQFDLWASNAVGVAGATAVSGESGTLTIYDVSGRAVRTLASSLTWDGRDGLARRVAAGLYFAVYRETGGATARTKLVRIE